MYNHITYFNFFKLYKVFAENLFECFIGKVVIKFKTKETCIILFKGYWYSLTLDIWLFEISFKEKY